MTYFEIIYDVVLTLFFLWILSYPVRWFLLPQYDDAFSNMDSFITYQLTMIPFRIVGLWSALSIIVYALGNILIVLLIPFGLVVLIYAIQAHAVNFNFDIESIYKLAVKLADDKAAWAALTIFVAANVAIGNMHKLNIDKQAYLDKRRKEAQEREEAKRERESKNREAAYNKNRPY